jgi:hypothetical protein
MTKDSKKQAWIVYRQILIKNIVAVHRFRGSRFEVREV